MPERNSIHREGLLLFCIAVASAFWVGPSGFLYWDSYGYTEQALTGHPGGLALGRPLFVLLSHALVALHRWLGGSVRTIEPLLRWSWLLVSALAAPAMAAVARNVGISRKGSFFAGLAIACSPAYAHTASAVLTDAPAAAVLLGALWFALRGRAGSSGLLAGMAFGLREPSAAVLLSLAWIVWITEEQRTQRVKNGVLLSAGFVLSASVPLLWAWWSTPWWWTTVVGWLGAMERERAQYPYGIREFGRYLLWLWSLGPVLLCGGVLGIFRWGALRSVREKACAVSIPALVQLLLLSRYQDIGFSPRYLLGVFAPALALPFGWWMSEKSTRWGWVALVLPVLCAGPLLERQQRPLRTMLEETPRRAQGLPSQLLFVGGQSCPAMRYERRMRRYEPGHERDSWRFLCAGWDWPERLEPVLEAERNRGTTLVLDLRTEAWTGQRQQAALAEVRAYALRVGAGVVRWQ